MEHLVGFPFVCEGGLFCADNCNIKVREPSVMAVPLTRWDDADERRVQGGGHWGSQEIYKQDV